MTVQCQYPTQAHQLHLPSFMSNTIPSAKRYSSPIQTLRNPMSISRIHSTSQPLAQESGQPSIAATSISSNLEPNRSRQATLPPNLWASGTTVAPTNSRNFPTDNPNFTKVDGDDGPGPASKRPKLDDDGWIEEALKRGREERRVPDPYPMPQLTSPGQPWDPHARLRPKIVASQPQAQPSPRWLSPSGFGQSPTIRSATLSRRPSSAYSTTSPSHSPALTQRSITSANRQAPSSPHGGSGMGGFSDLEIGSRSTSMAPDTVDSSATFGQIYDTPRVVLSPRKTAETSKLEKLPKQVFMRIMMYCGYKDQVLLKKCSYGLYLAVDLESIPWEEKTSTILHEERHNPRNFPKKSPKSENADDHEDRADEDEEADQPKRTTKRKKAAAKADPSAPKSASHKTKAHVDTYGKWGCYCCYKILPAHYFEGALLEDKEGRTAKSNKLRGTNAAESDKKVDMRVEYVQILGAVVGLDLPTWLSKDQRSVQATDAEAYLREKMERGVNCDDLRAYYKNITRASHLVAPVRGITPVFAPSSAHFRRFNLDSVAKAPESDTNRSPRTIHPPLPAIQTREEELENIEPHSETFRPIFNFQAESSPQIAVDSASYTYQIQIPRDAARDTRPLTLPKTDPVSRICLPSKATPLQEPVLEVGDVVALRRICIPCGTKFAVYRRNCNRKIISKTDEQWWVCDCPEVRLAGRSPGCPTCGRKVIY